MFRVFGVIAAASVALMTVPASAADLISYDVYANGNVYISGGSFGDIGSGSFTNANGSGGGNFTSWAAATSSVTSTAQAFSTQYSTMAATGSLTTQYGAGTLTGTSSGTNVFNIDASSWSGLYALTLTGPGTGAIVNVAGTSIGNFVNLNLNGLAASNVVFNFYQASSLTMNGMNVGGSVLAPNAFFVMRGGSIAGSVVSDSFRGEGGTIGGAGYSGYAANANAVPEPASWIMMIAGMGAIGAVLRRRRRAIGAPLAA